LSYKTTVLNPIFGVITKVDSRCFPMLYFNPF